jgi:mRNA interferase RelE/StbE
MIAEIVQPYRAAVMNKINGLRENSERQGKRLVGPLQGYRSIQAAGRYRAIYHVKRAEVEVVVLTAGLRKEGNKADVYELTKKLIRSGLI